MTKTQPTTAKLPKARVGYSNRFQLDYISPKEGGEGMIYGTPDGTDEDSFPVAVIPCHTPAQAKQIVKAAEFLRLPEEEKVERVRRHLAQNWTGSYEEDARSVLAAVGMGGAK